jgi:hypothetical protein
MACHDANGMTGETRSPIHDGQLSPVRAAAGSSGSLVEWIVTAVRPFDFTVGSLVPPVFDAYGRVFHPAYLRQGEHIVEVPWAKIAAASGRVMHAGAQWGSVTGSWQYQRQAGIWTERPTVGELPPTTARHLAALLGEHTSSPEHCYFAVWCGWEAPTVTPVSGASGPCPKERTRIKQDANRRIEQWQQLLKESVTFALPHRKLWLLEGPLSAISAFYERFRDPPALWWPADRTWCVATDVDLMSTYLGAAEVTVGELVAATTCEAYRVSVDERIDWEADTQNPLPASP